MGSTIRGNRDQRFNVRTSNERRETTNGGEVQKTYDRSFTEHSSNRNPHAFISEPSDTDHKIDHVHEIVRDQLAPRIQTKSANAVLTDRRYFLYYRRKRTGRRCGCFLTETLSSTMLCLSSFWLYFGLLEYMNISILIQLNYSFLLLILWAY